ncbi:MAG: hypothetical protein H0S79_14255 [Anaerolineaceae bacterium]|nr:hypothetical protein [Anaerolineaceae bacterium]
MTFKTPTQRLLLLLIALILAGLTGCKGSAGASVEASSTPTATITNTPTPTQTSTPAFTITPRPSLTPTITATPYNTLTPTPEPSPVPERPAVLFRYQDINGKTVDWSYIHVTQIDYNQFDEVNDLWAFMSFQLLDRAIYQRNMEFLGEDITVYYLNVAHEFNGEMIQMQLVLGGTPGKNVAIEDIPAGGSAYIQVQVRESWQSFAPYVTHRDANRAYEYRDESYPLYFLKELQALLPTLPDEIILLADHPILFPQDDWPQVKLDMSRVSYLAARYQPFFEIDDYDRLIDQSAFAQALTDHILNGVELPAGLYAFSSQTLIIIEGN